VQKLTGRKVQWPAPIRNTNAAAMWRAGAAMRGTGEVLSRWVFRALPMREVLVAGWETTAP
jgi:hypothetical protein